jgi:hypothetical protein
MKPTYYTALWHNCQSCHIHYMSEEPHIRAYLCDECWNSMPHFVVGKKEEKKMKTKTKEEWSQLEWILYIWACLIVIAFTFGYMILK